LIDQQADDEKKTDKTEIAKNLDCAKFSQVSTWWLTPA